MLKGKFLLLMAVIPVTTLGCRQKPDLSYCLKNTSVVANIYFKNREIIYNNGYPDDQISQIIPCNPGIKRCFIGEISYFDPFTLNEHEYPLPAKTKILRNGSREVTINGKEFSYNYSQDRGLMPKRIQAIRAIDGAEFVYDLCSEG